jgi:hypothetical protein
MSTRREEFTPYWLQTAMPSIDSAEMPGLEVTYPWDYPWPHQSPLVRWSASNPSGPSALPPAFPATALHAGANSGFPAVPPTNQPGEQWPQGSTSAGWDYAAMPMPSAPSPTSPPTPPPSSWDPSSPSLWQTSVGADAQFPPPPLPTDPAERAALRMRQSVQPEGGRRTGTSTQTLEDIARTIPSGLARGTAATLGGAADARETALVAGQWLAGKLGYEPSPEQMEMIRREVRRTLMAMPGGYAAAGPTSEQIIKGTEAVTGPLYHPQTTGGKFVNSAVELAPGAALGAGSLSAIPGAVLRGGIIPGLASEAAGQLTEGTAAEPVARILAGLAGFGGATAAHARGAPGGWWDKARHAGADALVEGPMLAQHLHHQAADAKERQRLQAEYEQEQLRRIMGGGGW